MCSAGPTAYVSPPGVFYVNLSVEDVGPIVRRTLGDGEIIADLTLWDPSTGQHIPLKQDIPFLKLQTRRLMRNCGEVDPRRIEDSLKRGGYSALALALEGKAAAEITERVEASGLRGRGGSGQCCAEKWARFVEGTADSRCLTAYVKGWDTAAADLALLEGDPHLVLEGMALAALATGCDTGRLLIPPERDLALQTLEAAVKQACAYGLLGESILGTGFSFTVEVHASRLTRRPGDKGERRGRRGSPAELLHNVETLANLPWIVSNGAEDFRSVGTESCPGTTLVSLGGALRHRGVAEVPCGTPVMDIIEKLGGSGDGQGSLQEVCVGGPTGRLLPMSLLGEAVDREGARLGVGPGAADLVAFDDRDCVVSRVREAAGLVAQESCGKCAPCRIGTKRIEEILDRLWKCEGSASDLADLKEIGEVSGWTAGCDHGAHAADCVLSALTHFEETFLAHLTGGPCPSDACPGSRSV
jgi:NADH-quinone oxidoreductase subunit F